MSTFYDRFTARRSESQSVLCVGLDPDARLLPPGSTATLDGFVDFIERVVKGTGKHACAYKPNLAFFEALPFGEELLAQTVLLVRRMTPNALLIGDAKRGDISNTSRGYATAAFERWGFDAVTASPYMGIESLEPFLEYRERAVMVLCLTSNPGAQEFQLQGSPPLFEQVAMGVARRNKQSGNLWMVVGATRDGAGIRRVREIAPEVPLLVPGIGAQGGSLETVLGIVGLECLINSGRSIMYAAPELALVEEAARSAASSLVRQMQQIGKPHIGQRQ